MREPLESHILRLIYVLFGSYNETEPLGFDYSIPHLLVLILEQPTFLLIWEEWMAALFWITLFLELAIWTYLFHMPRELFFITFLLLLFRPRPSQLTWCPPLWVGAPILQTLADRQCHKVECLQINPLLGAGLLSFLVGQGSFLLLTFMPYLIYFTYLLQWKKEFAS